LFCFNSRIVKDHRQHSVFLDVIVSGKLRRPKVFS
jgi:hypothetical protein